MHKLESVIENEIQNSLEFSDTNRSPNPDKITKFRRKKNR